MIIIFVPSNCPCSEAVNSTSTLGITDSVVKKLAKKMIIMENSFALLCTAEVVIVKLKEQFRINHPYLQHCRILNWECNVLS